MKILKVRFKNLNSLFGDWEIDLSSFGCEGIFAITGPTGSGKTTVLDAICLGLYGRTPRLSNVTKSGNEIMSRNTGECFAEVEFETQKGRFRCHWSQHRARRSPEGDLQQPKHEISDCDSGQILESKIKEVASCIGTVTGMDFDRFTRSMLLAQGGFSAFLQASPSERAPILEQITGTDIYSDISVAVHERHRKEKETLERLKAEMAGTTVLDREREKAVEEELGKAKDEELRLTSEAKSFNLSLSWLNGLDVLKGEIAHLNDEIEELQTEQESFRPHRDRLNLALSAASLEAPYLQIEELRGQQRSNEKSLLEKEGALPDLERSLEDQVQSLKKAEQETCNGREALKNSVPKLKQVRSLDQAIASLKKQIEDLEGECGGIEVKIQSHGQAKIDQEADRSKAQEDLKAIDKYLSDNARNRWLVGGLAGLEAQIAEMSNRKKDIDEKESQRDKAETALKEAVHRLEALNEDLTLKKRDQENSSKDLQQAKDLLSRTLGDRLLREYRAEKESLLKEAAYIAKIASLENHRKRLEDGTPCPLCGSTEHPFAEGNVPVSDEIDGRIKELTDMIEKVECLESEIKALEDLKDEAERALGNLEKNELILSNDVKSSQKTLAQLEEEIEKLDSDFRRRKEALSKDLLPLGVDLREEDLTFLLDSLRDRLKSWELHQAKKEELNGMIATVEGEIKKLEALVEREKSSLELEMERLKVLQGNLSSVDDDRKKLYGDGDPDREEETLNEGLSKAEEIERRERNLHDDLFLKRDRAFNEIEALKKSLKERQSKLIDMESKFKSNLTAQGFPDEISFKEAMIPKEEREQLSNSAKELDDRQTELDGRGRDRRRRLEEELGKKVTEKSLEEIKSQIEAVEEGLGGARDLISALRHQLEENDKAKASLKDKQEELSKQEVEFRRWSNLHDLIGSSDGKKYRNYAQGLTFEMMVRHANQQLRKMTDRYLLVLDANQPLELSVVDSYQGDGLRSTKNLSGGESFIVSLSLALGLSQMSSKNVPVDSLFLDEGFGTLDQEALEIALDTLAELKNNGKVIGVISHVPALKERISAQIQITPGTRGRSEISGPGCRRLP